MLLPFLNVDMSKFYLGTLQHEHVFMNFPKCLLRCSQMLYSTDPIEYKENYVFFGAALVESISSTHWRENVCSLFIVFVSVGNYVNNVFVMYSCFR